MWGFAFRWDERAGPGGSLLVVGIPIVGERPLGFFPSLWILEVRL